MRCIFFMLSCLVSFSALADSDAIEKWKKQEAELAKIDRFAHDAPQFLKDTKLSSLRKLEGFIGEKKRVVPNKHDPDIDTTFYYFTYEGMELYGFVKNEELYLIKVTITDPKWKLINDIAVGKPIEKVFSVIGEPSLKEDGIVTYSYYETIKFYLSENIITKVEFIYYAG